MKLNSLLLLFNSNTTVITFNKSYLLRFFLKKKTAHAYLGRPYFSKSFGGKIVEV